MPSKDSFERWSFLHGHHFGGTNQSLKPRLFLGKTLGEFLAAVGENKATHRLSSQSTYVLKQFDIDWAETPLHEWGG